MTTLRLEKLRVMRGATAVVQDASLTASAGECIGLIGPNGAGKTSLMRAALGLLPHEGRSSLAIMPASERAKQVAWLPQQREIAWPMPVERIVALGRIPYLPKGAQLAPDDRALVADSLAALGLESFGQRTATDLSGGEQARVLIARALAQDTPILIADEPIAGLDPAHQIAAMRCFAGLADAGRTVVVSLHDLGLAARYCSRLVLMEHGHIVADDTPMAVLTEQNMKTVFGVSAHIEMTPRGLVFQPLDVLT